MRSSFRSLCSPPLPFARVDDDHKLALLTTKRTNADHDCADSRSSVSPNAASDGSEIRIVIESPIESPENCGHRGHGFFSRQSSSASNRQSLQWLPLFRNAGSTASLLPSSRRWRKCRRWARWRMPWHFLLLCTIFFFMVLGIVQFTVLISSIVVSFFPDDFDRAVDRWTRPVQTPGYPHTWPTDLSRDIFPTVCHSHNDYWRRIPLYSALQAGCISVEADVWHFDNELFVGHTKSSLSPKRTLRSMYINPLLEILDRQNPITPLHPSADSPRNGVFDTDPSQTLVLLIDFKTDGVTTWPSLLEQLSPLRERGYLTHFNGTAVVNGPITIVGTGNTPFESVMSNSTYRDVFFDAPLGKVVEDDDGGQYATGNLNQVPVDLELVPYNFTNSYYASVSFTKSIGTPWHFRLSSQQMHLLRAQIRGAHRHGLKVRYWSLPSWPRSLRNHIWSVFIQEGVDILNVDDLEGATKKEWIPPFVPWWS